MPRGLSDGQRGRRQCGNFPFLKGVLWHPSRTSSSTALIRLRPPDSGPRPWTATRSREDDPTVLLVHPDGRSPRIFFQLVPESKLVKNRVHLDLGATDAAAEAKRLCALGATVHAKREDVFVNGATSPP
ncbi:VOC family protein [Streptomyces sp. UG1]|uniref:VOC family protein n=1 Tax=Streptomyces sp. UG1 TaxID=3417652 RepID=UPI003CE7E35F